MDYGAKLQSASVIQSLSTTSDAYCSPTALNSRLLLKQDRKSSGDVLGSQTTSGLRRCRTLKYLGRLMNLIQVLYTVPSREASICTKAVQSNRQCSSRISILMTPFWPVPLTSRPLLLSSARFAAPPHTSPLQASQPPVHAFAQSPVVAPV